MLQIQNYVRVKSPDEAVELLRKNRSNQIIGGMMWLRMQTRNVMTAIDISDLGYDQIKEDEEGFLIGAMCTLRDLETHVELNKHFHYLLRDCVQDIVGVQFRNGATIGGSIYSRFGFSDILCALAALHCDVHLHAGGIIPLQEYIQAPYERDLITHIYLHKEPCLCAFTCVRKSATDLPVLNVAAAKGHDTCRIVIGSRPQKAQLFEVPLDEISNPEAIANRLYEQVSVGDNMRGSAEYRKKLVKALVLRVLKQIEEEGTEC